MPRDSGRLVLTDTGPIVAMIDPHDYSYDRCWRAAKTLSGKAMVTPIACLTEILYLLGRAGGYLLQRQLWSMVDSGALVIRTETATECINAGILMKKYSDVPMDFADGVLVVTASGLGTSTIFTIDEHFYAYRCVDGQSFTVVPG